MNWAAQEAGLATIAKVDHDFYPVPGVPQEYGVSINSHSATQNLYIKNNRPKPIVFEFHAQKDKVILRILDNLL